MSGQNPLAIVRHAFSMRSIYYPDSEGSWMSFILRTSSGLLHKPLNETAVSSFSSLCHVLGGDESGSVRDVSPAGIFFPF